MDFGAFLPHKSNEKLSAFNFETVKTKSGIRLQCDVAGGNLPPKLYYDVSINSNDISLLENANWAAIALLYPAMLMKADLEIDFAVSPRLLDALKFDVQRLLMGRDDRLGMVRVNAYDGSSNPVTRQDRGVGTGFSGGVDSFATLTRYSADFVAESLKTTHLATFHNIAPDATPVFDFLKKRTEDFGAAKGLQTMGVFSNIDTFFTADDNISKTAMFQYTHTLRNAASASVLSDYFNSYLYSSTFDYSQIRTSASRDIGYLDPILLPLLSTENFALVSACAGMTRLEKTLLIADNPDAQKLLHVCIRHAVPRGNDSFINCSSCWKCLRTMFEYEITGHLDKFSTVFNVERFRSNRGRVLRKLRKRAKEGDINTIASLQYARKHDLLAGFV